MVGSTTNRSLRNCKVKLVVQLYVHDMFLFSLYKWHLFKCKTRGKTSFCLQYAILSVKVLYVSSTFFAVGSWVTWFFSSWERKNCLQIWTNSQNDCSKQQPRTTLSGNSCHFFYLLSFASSSFFLRLTQITWPKTRGHIEYLSIICRLRRDWFSPNM